MMGVVRSRIPGWLAWAGGAVVAVVVVLLVLAHTPAAARWALDWTMAKVRAQWQLDLRATQLHVNLFTRRVTLDDVALAAPGHADEPFFAAKRITVTLPLAVFTGTVQLTSLDVDAGRVLLRREHGTIVNLPPSTGAPPPVNARRLDIRGLRLSDLSVDYLDRTADVEVVLTSLQGALDSRDVKLFAGAIGDVRATSLRVRVGDHTTTSGAISGRLGFDGSNVRLESFTVPLPEARVVADGEIRRVLDITDFKLRLSGALDLAPIAAWTPPLTPVAGAGTFEGTYEGLLGKAVLRAQFNAPAARLGRADPLPLTGTLVLTQDALTIDPFALTAPTTSASPREGQISGRFTYQLGAGGTSVEASFRDLDLDVALAAYDREPLTVAAWMDGTATIRTASSNAPMELTAKGTSRPLTRADRIALDGTWSARLRDEQWTFVHDHRLLDAARAYGTVAWPAADDPTKSPLSGPLTVEVQNLGPVVRAARRSGINLSPALVDAVGAGRADLVMDGTLDRMIVRGHVDAPDLRLQNLTASASADIVYDGDALTAAPFSLRTSGGALNGEVTMGMDSSRLAGRFDGEATDLAALAAPFVDATGLTGAMRISGTLGGTTDAPDVPFTVTSDGVAYDGVTLTGASARGRLRGTDVQFEEVRLDQAAGHAAGTAHYDYVSGAYTADLELAGFTWDRPVEGAPVDAVRLDGRFAGGGTTADPGGSGHITVTPSGGTYGEIVGPTELDAQFGGGRLNLTAFVPSLRTLAQASIVPTAPYAFRGTAAVNALDVQTVALTMGTLPDAVTGTVQLSSAFEGQLADLTTASAFVNLQDVNLSVGGMPVRLDRPARVALRGDDVTVEDLALTAGQSRLVVSGRLKDPRDSPLKASFDGDVSDVVALARAFAATPPITAAGRLTGTWQSRGDLRTADATLTLETARVAVEGYPPVEQLNARAAFDGTMLAVESLSGVWQGGGIQATAKIPRSVIEGTATGANPAAGRVDVKLQGLGPQALSPWLPAETIAGLEGRVSATLGLDVASLELAGLTGTLVLDEATVTAAGVPITQERPGRLSIAKGRLTFDDVAFSAGTPVVIGGGVTFGDEIALDVTLTGTPGLRPFSVLSPGMAVDGAATLDLHVLGTASAPRVEGRIDLDDAEVVMRDPRVIASDITGPIVFQGDRISIPDLRGFVNGGDLEVSGAVTVNGLTMTGGELTVQARGMAVEYPDDVDTEIDALFTIAPAPTPLIRGDVRVLRGAYRATISLPALVAFNATRSSVAAKQQPSAVDQVRLDVSVTTEDDLVIDNNYGRFDAGADLRLLGTVARPAVTGQVNLREGGEVFLLNSQYRLNESTISFTNPNSIEPDMNISMVTRTNGAEQTLTLSGTLNRLETNVTSDDPNATNNTVAGFLLGNGRFDDQRALQLLSGELLGVTGRAVGLDTLRLERGFVSDDIRQDPTLLSDTESDPGTRLTLSKQLSQDVEVVLSQGIGGGSLSGYVTYRPIRSVELRGTSIENTNRFVSIRHDISFGGAAAPAREHRGVSRVAVVEVPGLEGAQEAEVRKQLRLGPGDVFDFIKWRNDVDRVRAWYRGRHYLEARVRSSRREDPKGLVLTYRIEPGPPTELRIEGLAESRKLRRQLEELWSNAVFDRFLLEEIQNTLRHELVVQNVIGGQAEAVVESTSPTKVIRATVSGGQKVDKRRIVFEGAKTFSAGDLQTEVASYGLTDWGWLYPPSIANAVMSRYDGAGFKAAKVTAAEPTVVGQEGHLVVTIDEGPVTTIASATVSGTVPDGVTVRPLVESLQGQPYRYADVDSVVRQLNTRLAEAGYNSAAVKPVVTAPPNTTSATVDIAIEPGRQQRLAEVVVNGADRTRPSAIVNALGLREGAPVDYAQWAQARKRVYDTNVFRQVDVRPEVLPQPTLEGTEPVRANVTVAEWPTWRLRYGLQFDDRSDSGVGEDTTTRSRGLGVVANLQNRNLFGRAWTAGVYGLAARNLYSGNSYLSFPTFFHKPLQTNLYATTLLADIFPDDNGNPLIRRHRTQVSLEQRLRRGRSLQFVYGYRVTRDVQDGIDPEDPFLQKVLTGRFTASTFVDRRDDPFNAKLGWFSSFGVERVSEFESGGDSIKVQGTGYRYQTLGQVTFASAARVGLSFLGSLQTVDPFYVGGADTVRGYAESRLGPKNFAGIATGGNAMLILNQEVRAPVFSWIHGVAFVDAGNVFDSNSAVRFSRLEVGYGVGVRLNTPFSTFRVDVAWPATQSGKVRFYFGLGQVF